MVRQTNETVSFHELSGKLDARQVAWISPSATKNRSLRCISQTECEIKDFTKMVNEFRTKNTMKNYYYESPTFKLWGGSWDPTFELWRASWDSTFYALGGRGGESRIPMAWSHYYTMPNVCKHIFHISHVCISQNVKGVIRWNLRYIYVHVKTKI